MTQYYEYELIAMKHNIEKIMIFFEESARNPEHERYNDFKQSYDKYLKVKENTYYRLKRLRDDCLDAEMYVFEENMKLKKIYDDNDIMNHLTDPDAVEQLAYFYYSRHDLNKIGDNLIDEVYGVFLHDMFYVDNEFEYKDAFGTHINTDLSGSDTSSENGIERNEEEELDPEIFGYRINLDD